ncbi:hypothetical protein NX774_01760 [Massilia agilis]|uniref:Uncharacterized protein n=1 Tax=Massilia agilis TaxID=1811226 RepID=A0ABT2D5Q8_9BURK|nr:hypothetical protein [Massilia agilis]MCS0806649.1 hypothetical protein [Massilia agilis]
MPIKVRLRVSSALFAGALALAAHAHAAGAPAEDKAAAPATVRIKARINPGDLEYRWVFDNQKLLQGSLLAQARVVDFSWRILFTEFTLPEQDAWVPKGWAVALVGSNFEQTVPVARGGYFVLPALPVGLQGSTIMFREQSLQGHIGAAWRVRVGADQRLTYASFKQALKEIRAVQGAIPLHKSGLKLVRTGTYDALKACFLAGGGRTLVDGKPAADGSVGNCIILKFDSVSAANGQTIAFEGPLDIVTVVESADYLTYLDSPSPASVPSAAHEDGERATQGAAESAAPTNLSNLAYGWNFKRQLRLQADLPGQARLVNFVWRLSFDDLSEAEQDAWTPQGWALALAGKDFKQAVPVARGGYFLLPRLPSDRQDATLVFKEQGKRNLVGAAWVIRLRDGPRPYLYYGEVKEAIDTVRKAQDAIPEGHAELAALRAVRYDGLKACFLAADGVVFVGDMPTADATVGNCKVLRFDPAQNANQKIEFVGDLDAVTVVDTTPYPIQRR